MDPTLSELSKRYDIPEEILKLCPPTTPARGAARRKADFALQDKYPGQYVAYLDNWTGDELERVVVASAFGLAEFHDKLDQLPPDVRERVRTWLVPDPNEGLFIGGGEIRLVDEGDEESKSPRQCCGDTELTTGGDDGADSV